MIFIGLTDSVLLIKKDNALSSLLGDLGRVNLPEQRKGTTLLVI
jgi:hypothetical protein